MSLVPGVGLGHWETPSLWKYALETCLGDRAANSKKKSVGGSASAKLIFRVIDAWAETDRFSLRPAKVLRCQEFLRAIDFEPGVARFPLKRAQELMGDASTLVSVRRIPVY